MARRPGQKPDNRRELSRAGRQKGQAAAAAAGRTDWGQKPDNRSELSRTGRQKGQAAAAAEGRTLGGQNSRGGGRPRGSKDQKPRKVQAGGRQSGADHWSKRCKIEHGANGRPRKNQDALRGGISSLSSFAKKLLF